MLRRLCSLALFVGLASAMPVDAAPSCTHSRSGGLAGLPHPILFVTQFPVADDFATIGSTFANHAPNTDSAGRGGDLWLLRTDGTLCNLTREAGFGVSGLDQGTGAISVRDPHVHWDGRRALFSMVVGAPSRCFGGDGGARWQLYEATGLGAGQPFTITKVAHQPNEYNNVSPIYSPDGRIVFTSDRPRDGRAHLYPQFDEYESTPTNTGLWAMARSNGALQLLDHAPSGDFTPIVDSFGRIVFSRWDHLQTDQQALNPGWGAFDHVDEEPGASTVAATDVFPEPRFGPEGDGLRDHRFNHFFPWMIHPDGSELETLNHIGRHELHAFFHGLFEPGGDPNVGAFTAPGGSTRAENLFQIVEDPTIVGRYVGTAAPEFGTHAAGSLMHFSAPPWANPDTITLGALTVAASGHYRDPLVLADGTLIAAHTAETGSAGEQGPGFPGSCADATTVPTYDFRLKRLNGAGPPHTAGARLTGGGIVRDVRFWNTNPAYRKRFAGAMWELMPVEVRTRPAPPILGASLPGPEAQVFVDEGVDPAAFQKWLRDEELALVVSRDVTTRDAADRQQPYNLRIDGGTAETIPDGGIVYDVKYLQMLQGDLVRAYTLRSPGRRVLARPIPAPADGGPPNPSSTGAPGSVDLAADGSMAALLPAARATTWQLTDADDVPVVRERYWVTFAAGEIRVCASCHGLNSVDQAGSTAPTNPPEALRRLLTHWKATPLFADGFETETTEAWSFP
ncbi:MAG: hypothetical protein AAGE94_19525 [Acidobacteriota bacterium]